MEGMNPIERKDTTPVSEREQLARFIKDPANWTKARWPEVEEASRKLSGMERGLPATLRTPHTTAGLPTLH
jgi:hypothetical protein